MRIEASFIAVFHYIKMIQVGFARPLWRFVADGLKFEDLMWCFMHLVERLEEALVPLLEMPPQTCRRYGGGSLLLQLGIPNAFTVDAAFHVTACSLCLVLLDIK